tara:strand:+ start:325 stop:807 length:483 start_codon:yes stop_codon:yes gene_type:complete
MKNNKNYTRHLIECQCILSVYKNNTVPVYHKFPVFSKVEDNNFIETKYVLCNNCDALHEIKDICKSEIKWGKDAYISLVNTKEDIKFNLKSQGKDNIVEILEKNDCDISVWETVEHLIENNLEDNIVLSKKEIDNNIVYNCLYIKEGNIKIKKEIVQRYF